MTFIIKLLNNTPQIISKLNLKKSSLSIIIKKNIALRTGHVKLSRTGHFSIGGTMYIKCPSKISFQLDANTQISTNNNNQCTYINYNQDV